MFLLLSAEPEKAAEQAEQVPILVRLVNQYFGEWAYNFEMNYTYPKWKWLLAKFGSTPEAAFGAYTPENAIPWYTVMFVMACILSLVLIWIFKGKLSEDEPGHGQQTLEVGVLAVRSMLEDIVGPHGLQYFPVVMTFRGADPDFELDGTVPAVHVTDLGDQRDLCPGPVFVPLLQLDRYQREWAVRPSEALRRANLVDRSSDFSDRAD